MKKVKKALITVVGILFAIIMIAATGGLAIIPIILIIAYMSGWDGTRDGWEKDKDEVK
tara:strand:+ start:249 stop:422 length:174 start_codon:yes stop_codon:yes gene_type:complete